MDSNSEDISFIWKIIFNPRTAQLCIKLESILVENITHVEILLHYLY